jgi:hypothetical protein
MYGSFGYHHGNEPVGCLDIMLQIFHAVVQVHVMFLKEAVDFQARIEAEQTTHLRFAKQLPAISLQCDGFEDHAGQIADHFTRPAPGQRCHLHFYSRIEETYGDAVSAATAEA